MMNKNIKAFTILEVTITMLITALVIGITYASYSIIVKSYHSFTTKNDNMSVLITLDHLLRRDFDRADSILKDQDGISLKNGGKIVKYTFNPDFIVRTSSRIDTFKVQTEGLNTTFENESVYELQTTDELNRIDSIDFTLIFESQKIPCNYHKLYSSENLIQRNSDAVN